MLKTVTIARSRGYLQLQTATTAQRFLTTPRHPHQNLYMKEDDRTSLRPERSEGTQSGTDNEVAEHRSAYDPSKTSPESEMEASEEESKVEGRRSNPLNVSGANREVSRPRDRREGMPLRNKDKAGPSSRGWTRKNRIVNTDKPTRAENTEEPARTDKTGTR